MDTIPAEEDDVEHTESEDNDDDHDHDEEQVRPTPPRRRKRVSAGLIPLAGKTKSPKKSTPASRGKGKKTSKPDSNAKITVIPGSDEEEVTPKPVRQKKIQPRRKTLDDIEIVDVSEGVETPKVRAPRKKIQQKKLVEKTIPDSAGEERDVWVISSDDE